MGLKMNFKNDLTNNQRMLVVFWMRFVLIVWQTSRKFIAIKNVVVSRNKVAANLISVTPHVLLRESNF